MCDDLLDALRGIVEDSLTVWDGAAHVVFAGHLQTLSDWVETQGDVPPAIAAILESIDWVPDTNGHGDEIESAVVPAEIVAALRVFLEEL